MQSLSSLLTFPISSLSSPQSNVERTPLPPPSAHIVSTATQPAPSSFLPLHHARLFLAASRPVVWVCCDAAGKAHWRALLRKATGASAATLEAHWHFVDATAGDAFDGRPSERLKRLHGAVEATIQKACPAASSTPLPSSSLKGRTWYQARALVVLDDAAALAWALDSTAEDWIEEDEQEQAPNQDRSDGRLELLRRSGKKGGVKEDATGKGVARWIEGLAQLCTQYDCALLTHMTVENTTIIPPSLSNPHSSSRGGHGVGTGFDADDAGEEDDEDLVFEDIDDELESAPATAHEDISTVETKTKTVTASSSLPPDDTTDWRVDSLLRVLLASADFWIEVRGLRSGKARDCHGEICIHPLVRPLQAQGKPLPRLPLPLDPLRHDRRRDASARSLSHLNNLSLSSSNGVGTAKKPTLPIRAWDFECWCPSRDKAMLFRLDQSGEGAVWPRGIPSSSSSA